MDNSTQAPGRKIRPEDAWAGSRLRTARLNAGISQERLANSVGLTFQQIQKYEKGVNRMGASRLQQFATLLSVTPAWFFDGMPSDGTMPEAVDLRRQAGKFQDAARFGDAIMKIDNIEVRRALVQLAERCAFAYSDSLVVATDPGSPLGIRFPHADEEAA